MSAPAGTTAMVEAGKPEVQVAHIAVCVCTYKRAVLLRRLLDELSRQETSGLFTYSVVIADNDEARSAEPVADAARTELGLAIKYCMDWLATRWLRMPMGTTWRSSTTMNFRAATGC